MHELQHLIEAAWAQIKPTLLANPRELERRLSRRRAATFTRPPRPWCLALRANDSRLPPYSILNPVQSSDGQAAPSSLSNSNAPSSILDPVLSPGAPVAPSSSSAPPSSSSAPPSSHSQPAAHQLTITAETLKNLTRPITLPSPGQDAEIVANQLGTKPNSLRLARHRNIFATRHIPLLSGKPGRPIPILHTNHQLDPSQPLRLLPNPLWGKIFDPARTREIIPPNFEQQLQRIPVFRRRNAQRLCPESKRNKPFHLPAPAPDYVSYKWKNNEPVNHDWKNPQATITHTRAEQRKQNRANNRRNKSKAQPKCTPSSIFNPPSSLSHSAPSSRSKVFKGWTWQCPRCKKNAKVLYLPIHAVCAVNFLEDLDPPPGHPHAYAPSPEHNELACHKCHRIRNISLFTQDGWNNLISHLTAGLLFGHEVERPQDVHPEQAQRVEGSCLSPSPGTPGEGWGEGLLQPLHGAQPFHRQRHYRPQQTRPAPRRQQVLRRVLNGWSIKQICKSLKMSRRSVHRHIQLLCQQERVATRQALAKKLKRRDQRIKAQ